MSKTEKESGTTRQEAELKAPLLSKICCAAAGTIAGIPLGGIGAIPGCALGWSLPDTWCGLKK